MVNKSLYAVPHKTKEWGGEHATVGYRAPTPQQAARRAAARPDAAVAQAGTGSSRLQRQIHE